MLTLTIIIFVLIAWNGISEVIHYKERKNLYNRLMAKNLSEVKSYEAPKKAKPNTNHGNPIRKKLMEDGIYDSLIDEGRL